MKTLAITVFVAAFAMAVPPSAGSSPQAATALRTSLVGRLPLEQVAPSRAEPPQTPKGDAANGKKLFVSYGCYQCHGYEGQGSSATGPRLAPRPIPFAAFSKQLRHPSSEMPPYTVKVATDAQLVDIYAFLQSVPPPKDLDTIPLLK